MYCFSSFLSKNFNHIWANIVWYFKENEKKVATMCGIMEKMRDKTLPEQNIKNLLCLLKIWWRTWILVQSKSWIFRKQIVKCCCNSCNAIVKNTYFQKYKTPIGENPVGVLWFLWQKADCRAVQEKYWN